MNRFKTATKSSDAGKPVSRGEFIGGATAVQSQVGDRSFKSMYADFDLDPSEHRRLKMRAVEANVSIADLVRDLIRREISQLVRGSIAQFSNSIHEKDMTRMTDAEQTALKRLIVHAAYSNGQNQRAADFLLVQWNPDQYGGFGTTVAWELDDEIVENVVVVFDCVARNNHYPDTLGYGLQFRTIIREW